MGTLRHFLLRLFAVLWNQSSRSSQFFLSELHARWLSQKWTRWLIEPYCWWQYGGPAKQVLTNYQPASGMRRYQSFQDFFARRLRLLPIITAAAIWPCDGQLCDARFFTLDDDDSSAQIHIKGETIKLRHAFGKIGPQIPQGYYFANIFLHNRDYHRIHAPVTGTITAIERIPGDLYFLRPWLYPKSPSLPAMINERVVVTITDRDQRPWYLSIVGGPGVATVAMTSQIRVGARIDIGEEVAYFRLGSTCCIAAPISDRTIYPRQVAMGESFGTLKLNQTIYATQAFPTTNSDAFAQV